MLVNCCMVLFEQPQFEEQCNSKRTDEVTASLNTKDQSESSSEN